jgi:hypothetical protein
MSFSTSSRDFREHKRSAGQLRVLYAGAIAGPLLWLASLEAAFALNYPACWFSTKWMLFAAALAPAPFVAGLGWLIRRIEPARMGGGEEPWPVWLATLGLATCGFFIIVMLAMLVPIAGLDACR